MILVSVLLMTVWMSALVLGLTLGGLVHGLAIAAVAIIFMSGNRRSHPSYR
jgi:hypothetical protein